MQFLLLPRNALGREFAQCKLFVSFHKEIWVGPDAVCLSVSAVPGNRYQKLLRAYWQGYDATVGF